MQNRFKKRVLFTAAAAAVAVSAFAVSSSQAALTITLSEPGFAPVTYTAPAGTGQLTNTVTYGTYNLFNLEIAASDKNQTSPTPSLATLQIQAIVESTTANGSNNALTITTSDTGYTFPGTTGAVDFLDSTVGGTLAPASLGDLITFQSTATANSGVPASNVSSGLQSYVYTGPVPQNTVSFSVPDMNTTFVRGSSFDLTNSLTLTMQSPYEQVNVSGTTTVSFVQSRVPEPTSAALVLGAAGSALLSRRRRV